MREELSEGNRSMFSKDLREAIQLRLDQQDNHCFIFKSTWLCIVYVMSGLWICTAMSKL